MQACRESRRPSVRWLRYLTGRDSRSTGRRSCERRQVSDTGFSEPVRHVASLEGAYEPAPAPALRSRYHRCRQLLEVLELKRESSETIAIHRIEAGRDEHKVGYESVCRGVDPSLERFHIVLGLPARGHRDVPYTVMRAPVRRCPGSRVPRPLMHGDEVNVGLMLDERLSSIAVMNVPVDDEDS